MTTRPAPLLLALLALLAAAGAGAGESDWITFESARTGGAATPIRGFLAEPPGAHARPGVVLLHGCDGPRPYQRAWAHALAARGFVALLPDSQFSRHRPRACGKADETARAERVRDALGALDHLAGSPGVDRRRLAVLGWGDAPVQMLATGAGAVSDYSGVLRAAVILSPRCAPRSRTAQIPLLTIGAAPASPSCADAEAVERRLVELQPGFDDPDARVNGRPGRHYDATAHARAIETVAGFLDDHLSGPAQAGQRWRRQEPAATYGAGAAGGHWLVDPADPGPDLPPQGVSTFDRVFTAPGTQPPEHDIPYPFERLLARLREAYPEPSAGAPAWSTALIPYGRSLQRGAAAPDYVQSPRVVIAATGDAAPTAVVDARDRLFIAYQPRAGVLEAISYNEAAGRFEFQVVTDYRPGMQPRVGYAPRALCVSCHQNHAPIFPEAAWDETNANPRVVEHLRGLGKRFAGVAVNGLGPSAAAIDNATNRASTLSALQPLWREGCGGGASGARCRAGALLAMIEYRLSAATGFDAGDVLVGEAFVARLDARRRALWPHGLLVPGADLPNRDPLLTPTPAAVGADLDPLRPRAPAARWRPDDETVASRMVAGLASALPVDHLARLDEQVARIAADRPTTRRIVVAPCAVVRRGVPGRAGRLQASCASARGASAQLEIELEFTHMGATASGGAVAWLDIDGARYTNLAAAGTVHDADGTTRATLRLVHERRPERVRLRDGTAVERLDLEWTIPGSRGRGQGEARLVLASEFAPVHAALERLAADAQQNQAHPLGRGPFRARALTGLLLEALGAHPAEECCRTAAAPPPRLADRAPVNALAELGHTGPMRTFARYCGTCHATPGDSPPGFLAGDGAEARAALSRCGPRILHRLEMWRRPQAARARTPMPPPAGLRIAGVTAEAWRTGDDLAALRAYVARTLGDDGLDPQAVLERPYEEQPPCSGALDS